MGTSAITPAIPNDRQLLNVASRHASHASTISACPSRPTVRRRLRPGLVAALVPRRDDDAARDRPHRRRRGAPRPLFLRNRLFVRILERPRLHAAGGGAAAEGPLGAIDLLLSHGAVAARRLSWGFPVLLRRLYARLAHVLGEMGPADRQDFLRLSRHRARLRRGHGSELSASDPVPRAGRTRGEPGPRARRARAKARQPRGRAAAL